jgi:hypothetical protein
MGQTNMEIVIGIFVFVIDAWIAFSNYSLKKRREKLFLKYGDKEIVEKIINRMFWQRQTPEQLVDSLGRPIDVDTKILKTKSKEIWKYEQTGKGRFALRITVEDGYVVGWDKKS